MLTGCGLEWDGDQNYFIEFTNDTQTTVILWNYHLDRSDLATLAPGQSTKILAQINDSPQQLHVEQAAGPELGCIQITYKKKPTDAQLPISATRPCIPGVAYFN